MLDLQSSVSNGSDLQKWKANLGKTRDFLNESEAKKGKKTTTPVHGTGMNASPLSKYLT